MLVLVFLKLQKAGFGVSELKESGVSLEPLLNAGFSPKACVQAGFRYAEFGRYLADDSVHKFKENDFCITKMFQAKIPAHLFFQDKALTKKELRKAVRQVKRDKALSKVIFDTMGKENFNVVEENSKILPCSIL